MSNILLVTDAWRPQVNGVVTSFEKIISLLEAQGDRVRVVHPGLFKTMPLFFYPEIKLSIMPSRTIRKIIGEFNPDHIHIATEGPLGFAARRIAIKRGLAFTTSYHTHFHYYMKVRVRILEKIVERYLRFFHSAAARTMASTPGLKAELAKMGITRVEIWPLGVDTALFARQNAQPPAGLLKPIFVYFGRLAPEKNVEEFLKLDLPGSKLVIGDGPSRAAYEARYGKTATFTGYKKGAELVHALSACDVFVFPSLTDTFGLVVLEALSLGIPVAAHDVLGPRDILTNGVDGYLSDDLAAAAKKCLSLKSENCRRTAEKYSWEKSAGIYASLLVPARSRL